MSTPHQAQQLKQSPNNPMIESAINQPSISERSFQVEMDQKIATPINRLDIDGLRGLAIIFVVGYNTFPTYFPGGFIGVPIFFVISGYLITLSILRQYKLTNKFSFMNFYGRRIRRIIPPFLLMLTVNYLIYFYCKTPLQIQQITKDSIPTLFMIQNLRQNYNQATLPAVPPNSLSGLWTLGIQVQFYLIWPAVVLLLWKINRHYITMIGILITAFVLYIIRYSFTLAGSGVKGVIVYSISQSWQILLGCAVAYYQAVFGNIVQKQFSPLEKQDMSNIENSTNLSCIKNCTKKINGIQGLISLAGVALLLYSFKIGNITTDSFFTRLLVIFSTSAILYTKPGILTDCILGNFFMVFIGRISYPWSLVHYPVLFFCSFATKYMQCLLGLYWAIFCMVSIDSKIRWNKSKFVVPGICVSLIGIYLLSKIIEKYPTYFMIPKIQM